MAGHVHIGRRWAVGAAVFGFVWLGAYMTLQVAEGNNSLLQLSPFLLASFVALMLALGAVLVPSVRAARWLLGTSAAVFIVLGILGALTIGVGWLLAGTAAAIGAPKLGEPTRSER